jgi:hypothetical protein
MPCVPMRSCADAERFRRGWINYCRISCLREVNWSSEDERNRETPGAFSRTAMAENAFLVAYGTVDTRALLSCLVPSPRHGMRTWLQCLRRTSLVCLFVVCLSISSGILTSVWKHHGGQSSAPYYANKPSDGSRG